jgi:hypothetical protein
MSQCDYLKDAIAISPGFGVPLYIPCAVTVTNKVFYAAKLKFETEEGLNTFRRFIHSISGFSDFIANSNIVCNSTVKLVENKKVLVSRFVDAQLTPCLVV